MLVPRFERAGVELLVEVGDPFIGDPIEAAGDAFDETVAREYGQAIAGMILHGDAEVFDCRRGHIPFISHELKDGIVDRVHPLSALSHAIRSTVAHHSGADVRELTPQWRLTIPPKGVFTLQKRLETPQ